MKKLICAMAAPLLAFSAWCVTPLTGWTGQAVPVRSPFMNDSISPDGQKYKSENLLETRLPKELSGARQYTADTAGIVALEKVDKDGAKSLLHIMQTRIRSQRFAKGKIKVTSAAPVSILLDGKQLATKGGGDSVATASVRLEPERDALLTLRVLVSPTDSVSPDFKAEYIPDEGFEEITLYNGPDLKRRLALPDTQYGGQISRAFISPDGRYLIMNEYSSFDDTHSRYRTTLTDLNSGKIINAGLPWGARWMPDKNIMYYTEKTPDGYDLFNIDPVSGRETLVAGGLPEKSFQWAPDGSFIIYSREDKGVKEEGPLRRYATPDDRMPTDRERSFLVRYDIATGVSEQLTFGNHSTSLCDISPDGKSIIVMTSREDPTVRPFYNSTVYLLDLETLKADTLVAPGPAFVNNAMFSPNGKEVLFLGSPEAFGGIGKNCGSHPIANDFDIQMFIMNLADRKVKPITRDFDPNVENAEWNKADGKIYFTAEKGFDVPMFVYDPKSDKFTELKLDVPYVSYFSLPDKTYGRMVYGGGSYTYSGRALLYNFKTGKNTLLADPNGKNMARIELGEMEPWNFTARDGSTIEGWICYPPHFNADKKYPLIVYYYGGTSPSQQRLMQPYTPQLLASRDYVVFVLNPSGTTGYGQEFSARHVNAWGKYTADDIIEGVKKFCDDHAFVNRDKVGCMGASYGGFMTQYLQTQTPIFASAVSHAGISNVASYWGEGYWGYSYNSVAAADSYPWNNPDLYTRQGSLFNADKINTPLLLLHGTADTNVPIGESIQLFNALRVLGKDVEFVSVDGENHFISDFAKRQLWQNTIMAWFAKYLQDDPKWWNDLYPERHL